MPSFNFKGTREQENNFTSESQENNQNLIRGESSILPVDTADELEGDEDGESPISARSSSYHRRQSVEEMQKIKELSFTEKVAIGSGHILNDLCASLWFSYLLLYLQKVADFDSGHAAGLMLLGQIVDALATPLIGYEADRSSNNFWLCRTNYGKCKSWHLFGIILVILSFPFVFTSCVVCENVTDWAKLIYYGPFIAIFQIGWASNQISHLALIPKMHPDELIRTQIISIRYAFTVLSNVTIFTMTWFTLGFSKDCEIGPIDAPKFRNVALIAVGIGAFFSILFHVFVKEETDEDIKRAVANLNANKKYLQKRKNQVAKLNHNNVLVRRNSRWKERSANYRINGEDYDEDTVRALLSSSPHSDISNNEENENYSSGDEDFERNESFPENRVCLSTKALSMGKDVMKVKDWMSLPQFYAVALVYMSTRLSINLTQVYMPLYLQNSLKLPCGSVASIPLTMYTSGFIISFFMKLIHKYIGRQFTYILGGLFSLCGSLLVIYLDWDDLFLKNIGIYGVASLLGIGASSLLITSLSITADMIGNNVESGAFVYGAMSFTDKLSCGAAVMLINMFVPCEQEDGSCDWNKLIPFYRRVIGFACGGCALIGMIGIIILTYIIYLQEKKRIQEERNSRERPTR